ncbi:N-6 DNA methylase [Salinispira pacifica]|uniref:site-specific DNA-methyltransferase (adenine-specific) n=1 Tax=Salinispira pacifica TaxID=1307761 RepID=V5WEZ3_9SPIO|nr:N-6 DNA methylase [Salinispira pacifica]AHC14109.1 Type I restriction-modification system, DNA-methyltransferase subunit M [Salinispira pacifica]
MKDVTRGDYRQIRDDYFAAQRLLFLGFLKDGNLTTPIEVADILQRILQVQPGESVLDPFMGGGELLLRSASEARQLSGQDKELLMVTLASVNALVSNKTVEVREADSLMKPLPGKADVVLSHIPFTPRFSMSGDPPAYMKFGMPGSNGGSYYYLSMMLHRMNRRGAALVTEGDLIRGGGEADIRRRLIEEGLIDAVIALPPGIYEGSSIGSSILLFSKERTTDSIQFIDARGLFQKIRGGVRLSEDGLNRIDRLYTKQLVEPGFSCYVKPNEVMDENAVLTVQRYTAVQEKRDRGDIAQLESRMKQLEEQMDTQRSEVNRLITKTF